MTDIPRFDNSSEDDFRPEADWVDQQPAAPEQPSAERRRPARRSGNEVIWTGNPCWKAMIPLYLRGILISVVLTALAVGLNLAGVIGFALVIITALVVISASWAVCYFIQRMTVYTLTRSRVLKKSGIINIRKEQARLEMVTNIIVDRSLSQRILGIGDLNIDTANDSAEILAWWGIKDPYKIEALIDGLRAGDYDHHDDQDDDPDFKY